MELYITILVFLVLLVIGCVIYCLRLSFGNLATPSRKDIMDNISAIPRSAKESSIRSIVDLMPSSMISDIIKEASQNTIQKKLQQNDMTHKLAGANKIQISELDASTKNNLATNLPWDDVPEEKSGIAQNDQVYNEKNINKHIITEKPVMTIY